MSRDSLDYSMLSMGEPLFCFKARSNAELARPLSRPFTFQRATCKGKHTALSPSNFLTCSLLPKFPLLIFPFHPHRKHPKHLLSGHPISIRQYAACLDEATEEAKGQASPSSSPSPRPGKNDFHKKSSNQCFSQSPTFLLRSFTFLPSPKALPHIPNHSGQTSVNKPVST